MHGVTIAVANQKPRFYPLAYDPDLDVQNNLVEGYVFPIVRFVLEFVNDEDVKTLVKKAKEVLIPLTLIINSDSANVKKLSMLASVEVSGNCVEIETLLDDIGYVEE